MAEAQETAYLKFFRGQLEHQTSIVDDLLFEIYDRWQDGRHDSFESDTFTECSSTSEVFHWRRNSFQVEIENNHSGRLHQAVLETKSFDQLRRMVTELQHRGNQMSSRLVRQLKRRERRQAKLQHNCDIVTAVLQASSLKRRIDTRIRFSIEPPPGETAFDQWRDAMKAVARLPLGIPDEFRKKVWLSLADNHIKELRIDWDRTVRFAFNDRSNPDDNKLGMQIVKDLHRTGCSGFSGEENEEDRASLKRVLLAYARWNKNVGYCQGFNVMAALLLEVVDRKEADALKVMIYLIDHVLPDSYFANNLRALSVDMAVFRDLLRLIFPKLSKQLDYLQYAAQDQTTGTSYEPPLTNVFTMQWFLTLFATCLPKDIVLRVWDSILLEGSEILLRTALAIWGKLSRRILSVGCADEFYSLMGTLTQDMMEGRIFDADSLIKFIYSCAPYPLLQLSELREKYTYNIRPFTGSNPANSNKKSSVLGGLLPSDEDELDDDDLEAISCFGGILPPNLSSSKSKGAEGETFGSMPDISAVGPGAYGNTPESNLAASLSPYMERMTTDIGALKKQYAKLKQRQNQAHIIIAAASAKQVTKARAMVPKIETPKAMNHLFVGKHCPPLNSKNRFVAASPRIAANVYPKSVLVSCQNEQDKLKVPSNKSSHVKSINSESCDLNNKSGGDASPGSSNKSSNVEMKDLDRHDSVKDVSMTNNESGDLDSKSCDNITMSHDHPTKSVEHNSIVYDNVTENSESCEEIKLSQKSVSDDKDLIEMEPLQPMDLTDLKEEHIYQEVAQKYTSDKTDLSDDKDKQSKSDEKQPHETDSGVDIHQPNDEIHHPGFESDKVHQRDSGANVDYQGTGTHRLVPQSDEVHQTDSGVSVHQGDDEIHQPVCPSDEVYQTDSGVSVNQGDGEIHKSNSNELCGQNNVKRLVRTSSLDAEMIYDKETSHVSESNILTEIRCKQQTSENVNKESTDNDVFKCALDDETRTLTSDYKGKREIFISSSLSSKGGVVCQETEPSDQNITSILESSNRSYLPCEEKPDMGNKDIKSSDSGFIETSSPEHISNDAQANKGYKEFVEGLKVIQGDNSSPDNKDNSDENYNQNYRNIESVKDGIGIYAKMSLNTECKKEGNKDEILSCKTDLDNEKTLSIEEEITKLLESEESSAYDYENRSSVKNSSGLKISTSNHSNSSDLDTDSSVRNSPNSTISSINYSDSDSSPVFSPADPSSPSHFSDIEKNLSSDGDRRRYLSDVPAQYLQSKRSGNFKLTKPFNPFPVKHINENRAKTGVKLGIYTSSTLQQLEKQTKRRPLWSK